MRHVLRWRRQLPISVLVNVAFLVTAPSMAASFESPDGWTTAKVATTLLSDGNVDATAIRVDTYDGRVTLFGWTETAADKQRAEEAALRVEGVRSVRNLVQVVPPDGEIAVALADAAVMRRVSAALDREFGPERDGIAVESVVDGLVLLSTSSATVERYRRAVEAARSERGVRCVATLMKTSDRDVAAEQPREGCDGEPNLAQDLYIAVVSKLRLLANGATSPYDIEVAADDGVVKVTGIVPSVAARAVAEMEIRRVRWVRRVENQLRVVAADAPPSDAASAATVDARAAG